METKEKSCAERIDAQLKTLEGDCKALLKRYNKGSEEAFEEWNNYPLDVDTRKVTKIELSWGGPSDFLKVEHDGREIYSVEYHFQDWFDGAMRHVEIGRAHV